MPEAVWVTCLAFLLSLLFSQPLSFSAATILQSKDKGDFNMTDFYCTAADSRPVRALDPDIVIVDIADTDRDDVTDVIRLLSYMNPAVVGLDVTFAEPRENDESLIDAISACQNVVMAGGVSRTSDSPERFTLDDTTYFYNALAPEARLGVVNFPTSRSGKTIRSFRPTFITENSDTLESFATAVTALYRGEKVSAMTSESNLRIDFPSRRFTIVPWQEVADRPEKIEGRIVLVGAIGEATDLHPTPIGQETDGVLIHAYAASTLLRGEHYTETGRPFTMTMAFLLSLLLCVLMLTYSSPARGMWLRVLQIGVLYILIRIGYYLYVDHRFVIDISYPLLMLTFCFFALDIWAGLKHYGKSAATFIRNKSRQTTNLKQQPS